MGIDTNKIRSYLTSGIDAADNSISSIRDGLQSTSSSVDDNLLPSSKTKSNKLHVSKRNIINWFVPEIGTVSMYINPKQIRYNYKKIINKEPTKGGFVLQYWGEELLELSISGTTGSSGIEGINVLEEIYRAEQIAFDPIGLTLEATLQTSNAVSNFIQPSNSGDGSWWDGVRGVTSDLLNESSLASEMLPNNLPTMASIAFGVQMYYAGQVFRGYFNNFNVTESAESPGLFDYDFNFTVTQKKGYRYNYMPWHRSANNGPSNHDSVPLTFGPSYTQNKIKK